MAREMNASSPQEKSGYVLITPARNEAEFIGRTIRSVVAQTVLPNRWIIVSDRSTDGTDEIICSYSREYDFVSYLRKTGGSARGTAAKVDAFNFALAQLSEVPFGFVGNLDADISFGPRYFEFLLDKLEKDAHLGIVGGRIHLVRHGRLVEHRSSMESVAGAVQFFRRQCFEEIGGYKPLAGGFEDGLAEIEARWHGWKTRSFGEQVVIHHREIGTIGRSVYKLRFDSGVNEFRIGFGFGYHLSRNLFYLLQKPAIVGSLFVLAGYVSAWVRRRPKVLPAATIRYLRREERKRLERGLLRMAGIKVRC